MVGTRMKNKKAAAAASTKKKITARKKRHQEQEQARQETKRRKKVQQEEEEYHSPAEESEDDETVVEDQKGGKTTNLRASTGKNGKPQGKLKDPRSYDPRHQESDSDDDADPEEEDKEMDAEALKKQLEKIQRENLRMKNSLKMRAGGKGFRSKPKGGKPKGGTLSAIQELIFSASKKHLWQRCKFIRSDTKLRKGTKFVFDKLDLTEFEGLEGDQRNEAIEQWIATNENLVRQGINAQRNYVVGELRTYVVEKMKAGKTGEVPNKEEMLNLALRKDLGDSEDDEDTNTRMRNLMVVYWDRLLPKVCGSDFWSPTKRHYGLISFMKPAPTREDPDPHPYVDESAEALLVWAWENYYDRWEHQAKCELGNKGKKKGDEGYVDPDAKDPTTKKYVAKEMETPYTSSNQGQQRFGGLNKTGKKRMVELHEMIVENRKEHPEDIKAVEASILELVRKKNKRNEIDERKKQRGKKVVAVLEASVEDSDDEEDDENDYSKW